MMEDDGYTRIGNNKIVHDVLRDGNAWITLCGIKVEYSKLNGDVWPDWFKEMSLEEYEEFDKNGGIPHFDYYCKRCERCW